MIFSMIPEMTFIMETGNVMAEEVVDESLEDEEYDEAATWNFDAETGTLTYSGGIYVESYGCEDYAEQVKKIVFDESIEEVYEDYEGVQFTNLEEVVIPASLTYFEIDIITHSSKLNTITVAEDNEVFYTIDGNLYSYNKYEWEDEEDEEGGVVEEFYSLVRYIPTKTDKIYTLPDGVGSIEYGAFAMAANIEGIVLNETMEGFLLDSLYGMSSLNKLTFKNPETIFFIFDITGFEELIICGYENILIEEVANEYDLTFEALPERKVKSMSIKTYPDKMIYEVGRTFISDGLVLDVEYEDGGTAERTMGYEVLGFDSSEVGECEVTISLGGATVSFTVEIIKLDTSKIMQIGIDKEVTLEDSYDYVEIYFTPVLSGEYSFYTKCSYDTYCELYENDEFLHEADDLEDGDEYDYNFNLTYELEAGKTYILRVSTYEENGCTFNVKSKLLSTDDPHEEHNYISYVTEATDNSDGYIEYICDACGDSYTEYIHDYKTTVIPATCTSKGFTLHECENCGDVYSDNEVPMLKHNYVETILKPATTTETGEKQFKCSECGDSYTESIAKLPAETTAEKETTTADTEKIKKPGQVKKLKAKVSLKKVNLSWKKNKKVAGYEVRIGKGKKVKKAVKKFTRKNKLTYKKIKKKKTYYFKVRAYRMDGKKKVFGKWSKSKKFVVKK